MKKPEQIIQGAMVNARAGQDDEVHLRRTTRISSIQPTAFAPA
jgi:hypothetical protein